MNKSLLAAFLATGCAVGALCPVAAQAQTDQRDYDIAAQPLGDALQEYADVSGRQILFATELVKGRRSILVRGRMSSDRALSRLLAGTGLLPELVEGALTLRAGNGAAADNGSTESGAFVFSARSKSLTLSNVLNDFSAMRFLLAGTFAAASAARPSKTWVSSTNTALSSKKAFPPGSWPPTINGRTWLGSKWLHAPKGAAAAFE